MNIRNAAWCCVVLSLFGCNFTSTLGSKVVVTCKSDKDCKTGLCQKSTGTCVAKPDSTPPSLSGPATLTLTPAPGSLLSQVSGLAPGALLTVDVETQEPIVPPTLTSPCAEISCSLARSTTTRFIFECQFVEAAPAPVETTCELSLAMTDTQNNSATVAIEPGVFIDSNPPAPPDTLTPDAVVLQRIPWGSADTGGLARQSLTTTFLEPGAAVVVWESATATALPFLLGPTDQASLTLPDLDRPIVYVAYVDGAGNVSERRKVLDVELVTTFGTAVGSGGNPNRVETSMAHSAARIQPEGSSKPADSPLLASVDGRTLSTRGAGTWKERSYLSPPPSAGSASAYDTWRARWVSYGGCPCTSQGCFTPTTLLFEYDGENWHPMPTSDFGQGLPPALMHGAMVFDADQGQTLLFGGELSGDAGVSDETWLWNGTSWSRGLNTKSPAGRSKASMAYDTAGKRIILFGGRDPSGALLSDTWEWKAGEWRQLTWPKAPEARSGHRLAYDAKQRTVVLSGGRTANGLVWDVWRLTPGGWEKDAAMSTTLLPRQNHGFDYDTVTDRWIVSGGEVNGGGFAADLYTFNGATWTSWPYVGAASNTGRSDGRFVYDPARNEPVWSGGIVCPGTTLNVLVDGLRTYAYSFAAKTQLIRHESNSLYGYVAPVARVGHAMAYDYDRKVTIIHGGEDGTTAVDDTYEWNGLTMDRWVYNPSLGAGTAGGRKFHAMAYDGTSKRMVLFGGQGEVGETFEKRDSGYEALLVDAGTWVGHVEYGWKRLPGSSPPMRAFHAMVANPNTRRVHLLGGSSVIKTKGSDLRFNDSSMNFDDHWSFAGSSWSKRTSLPTISIGTGAAFDFRRNRLVAMPGLSFNIFGIKVSPDQVWELDDAQMTQTWVVSSPPQYPPQRELQNMVYDSWSERVLLYGTAGSNNSLGRAAADRLWEWTAPTFREVPLSNAEAATPANGKPVTPGVRVGFRWAFDDARGRTVLFGGQTSDLWEFEYATRKPRQVFVLGLDAARVTSDATVRSLRVQVVAGADAKARQQSGEWTTAPGVEVLPWYEGAWRAPVATNSASSASLGVAEGAIASDQVPRLTTAAHELAFAIVPVGVNGNSNATVVTDYVEAVVKYRLAP